MANPDLEFGVDVIVRWDQTATPAGIESRGTNLGWSGPFETVSMGDLAVGDKHFVLERQKAVDGDRYKFALVDDGGRTYEFGSELEVLGIEGNPEKFVLSEVLAARKHLGIRGDPVGGFVIMTKLASDVPIRFYPQTAFELVSGDRPGQRRLPGQNEISRMPWERSEDMFGDSSGQRHRSMPSYAFRLTAGQEWEFVADVPGLLGTITVGSRPFSIRRFAAREIDIFEITDEAGVSIHIPSGASVGYDGSRWHHNPDTGVDDIVVEGNPKTRCLFVWPISSDIDVVFDNSPGVELVSVHPVTSEERDARISQLGPDLVELLRSSIARIPNDSGDLGSL